MLDRVIPNISGKYCTRNWKVLDEDAEGGHHLAIDKQKECTVGGRGPEPVNEPVPVIERCGESYHDDLEL